MPCVSRIVPTSEGCAFVDEEGDDSDLAGRGSDERHVRKVREALHPVAEHVRLVSVDDVAIVRREPLDRGAEADHARDVGRARFELVREARSRSCVPERDLVDHVAAALVGRHRFEKLRACVEDADPGRAVELVPAEGVEVAVERLDVDALVDDALRTVDEHVRADRVRDAR